MSISGLLCFSSSGMVSYIQKGGGNLKGTPKRYQDPILWVWLEMFFTPKSYEFSSNTFNNIACLWFNILQDTTSSPLEFISLSILLR